MQPAESGTWLDTKKMEIPSPGGIAAHSACCIDKRMFICGGYDGANKLSDVYVFNAETLTWSRPKVYGTPPSGRSYHSMSVVDNKMYIHGGYDGVNRSDELYVLEIGIRV